MLKINGKSYIYLNISKVEYFIVNDGKINLNGILVDKSITVKCVMVVVQERQAYTDGRNETQKIIRT